MPDNLTLNDPIIRGLACAALHPKLRAVLLINATPTQVQQYARLMEQMLAAVTGTAPSSCTLHLATTEDQLWGLPALPISEGNTQFIQRGLLRNNNDRQPQLVVIPDLATLSLPANRAAVMAMDADVLHVERHGQHEQWRPNLCWLAGCAEHEISRVSPHLLDRFLVRIPVPMSQTPKRSGTDLMAELNLSDDGVQDGLQLHPDMIAALQQAPNHGQPALTPQATEQILQYISAMDIYTPRRDLALARLAVALAWLENANQVNADHIDDATQIMSLARQRENRIEPINREQATADESLLGETNDRDTLDDLKSWFHSGDNDDNEIQKIEFQPVHESDTEEVQQILSLNTSQAVPYPEDTTPPNRVLDTLRPPMYHNYNSTRRRGGATIGVEPTTDMDDLAIVSTLFEALKSQRLRRQITDQIDTRLLIRRSDLRCYRRLPLPETLLVMVIDYTALDHCNWTVELQPILEWAYTSRASIALIRVGAKNAASELQAEKFVGRNLLDPQIGKALTAEAGMATPLAHGLYLAYQTLRHELQHGRSAILQAQLVVISDGRGNVTLSTSHTNEMPRAPINREGIDDALQIAQTISTLDRLDISVIDTQPPQHQELLQTLADRLGVVLPLAKQEAVQ